jgi:hypothetical protein
MSATQLAPGADLPPILQAVSRELASLGDMGSELQTVLSSLAIAHARLSGEPHAPGSEDIQALDLFTQRLFVLADFLGALAPTVTPGSRGDLGLALEGVNLADVAKRLGADKTDGDEPIDTGELELFGDDP